METTAPACTMTGSGGGGTSDRVTLPVLLRLTRLLGGGEGSWGSVLVSSTEEIRFMLGEVFSG